MQCDIAFTHKIARYKNETVYSCFTPPPTK